MRDACANRLRPLADSTKSSFLRRGWDSGELLITQKITAKQTRQRQVATNLTVADPNDKVLQMHEKPAAGTPLPLQYIVHTLHSVFRKSFLDVLSGSREQRFSSGQRIVMWIQ